MPLTKPALLVSVRDASEAAAALAGGAEIIDVKEPAAGSLGPASPSAVVDVARQVARQAPWTMACGEISTNAERVSARLAAILALLAEEGLSPPRAVKVGLSSMQGKAWQKALGVLADHLPQGVGQVAVVYADHEDCGAPPAEDVIKFAKETAAVAVLVDTFDKSSPGVLGVQPLARLRAWRDAAVAAGMGFALAGRLSIDEFATAACVLPDIIAVRSAVCSHGRNSPVEASLVRRAREAVVVADGCCWPADSPLRSAAVSLVCPSPENKHS
jgi:uncharacterized protein (UPF0264 family)